MFKYEMFSNDSGTHPVFGTQSEHYLFRFNNGYGASVIRNEFSYGSSAGLYELAVIRWNDEERYSLEYDTHITSDVVGHLSIDGVNDILDEIIKL